MLELLDAEVKLMQALQPHTPVQCGIHPTFSISLKSSSSLVPSAPPTFSLTSCWVQGGRHVRAQEKFLLTCGGQLLCLSRM